MQQLVEDVQDPGSQKVAVVFLSRCVVFWGQPDLPANQNLPGFERFIYERLVPTAFHVPSLPNFNLKDGQVTVVSSILLAWMASFESYCVVRFYTKSLTFYKLSVGQGGQKPTTSS
jgi:hypothetical protein